MLLFTRKEQFKFNGVNEPVLEECPGILGTETVTSSSGLAHPVFMVKAANGTYSLSTCVYLTLVQKENSG